jgi:hypothetical protein
MAIWNLDSLNDRALLGLQNEVSNELVNRKIRGTSMSNDESESIFADLVGQLVIVRLKEVHGGRDGFGSRLIAAKDGKLKFRNRNGRIFIEDETNIRSLVLQE